MRPNYGISANITQSAKLMPNAADGSCRLGCIKLCQPKDFKVMRNSCAEFVRPAPIGYHEEANRHEFALYDFSPQPTMTFDVVVVRVQSR